MDRAKATNENSKISLEIKLPPLIIIIREPKSVPIRR